jgi:hypothetical protein
MGIQDLAVQLDLTLRNDNPKNIDIAITDDHTIAYCKNGWLDELNDYSQNSFFLVDKDFKFKAKRYFIDNKLPDEMRVIYVFDTYFMYAVIERAVNMIVKQYGNTQFKCTGKSKFPLRISFNINHESYLCYIGHLEANEEDAKAAYKVSVIQNKLLGGF